MNLFENLQTLKESENNNDYNLNALNAKYFISETIKMLTDIRKQILVQEHCKPIYDIYQQTLELQTMFSDNEDVKTEGKNNDESINSTYDEALEAIMDSKPYKRLMELDYQVEIKENSLTIRFPKPDNDIYAHFTFNYDEDFEGYIVRCHSDNPNEKGELIIDDIESYETYEEVVKQCMYYFLNRF